MTKGEVVLFYLILFSAEADPLSGGAGWVGAGLLGMVLTWLLLRHLPDKDRQQERLLSSRDELMRQLLTEERASCEKRHRENLEEGRAWRETQERRHAEVLAHHNQIHAELKEARHGVANLDSNIGVWIALVKQMTSGNLPDAKSKTEAKP